MLSFRHFEYKQTLAAGGHWDLGTKISRKHRGLHAKTLIDTITSTDMLPILTGFR